MPWNKLGVNVVALNSPSSFPGFLVRFDPLSTVLYLGQAPHVTSDIPRPGATFRKRRLQLQGLLGLYESILAPEP